MLPKISVKYIIVLKIVNIQDTNTQFYASFVKVSIYYAKLWRTFSV